MRFGWKTDPLVEHAAPTFRLPAHDDTFVDLATFRGVQRVILAFYPEDDTPVGTHALRAFNAAVDRFEACHTQVLGISHNSVSSHARYAQRLGLRFPLLADPRGEVAKPYGAKGVLFFKRRTIVIDGHGVVRVVKKGMPDIEALLRLLDGLRGDLPGVAAELPEAEGGERYGYSDPPTLSALTGTFPVEGKE